MYFKKIISLSLSIILVWQVSAQKFEGLALTPPMGWNSWNTFETHIAVSYTHLDVYKRQPYKFSDEEREKNTLFTAEHKLLAKEAATKSVVLLKNNDQLLPLKKETKIALVGFYAQSKDDLFDFWIGQGKSDDAVTLLEGCLLYTSRCV